MPRTSERSDTERSAMQHGRVHAVDASSRLPHGRGPMSDVIVGVLRRDAPSTALSDVDVDEHDPYGDDLNLALHACYELHYRGFDGVDDEWEWDPDVLRFRALLERRMLDGIVHEVAGGDDVQAAIDQLLVEHVPGSGVSHHLRDAGQWWQMREYVVHRSIYHLKEADPQAWVIPRLQGQAKSSLVAVEYDEYGGGRGERLHAQLFADMMESMGLSGDYLHYLDDVPAPAICLVNLMSLFGLHRRWRGASVGQFALLEITSSPGSARLVKALERLGADAATTLFYREHVEADAVHEQLMRHQVIGGLLDQEPELASDVLFGMQATDLLETKLANHIAAAWAEERTSLIWPLQAA